MKAMILAAGLGTRLRPLTNDRPKALVEVAGRTMLELTIERLQTFGVDEIIVNAHYFADQIVDYLAANRNFGIRIEVSREETLLDTGGGLKNAAHFFLDHDSSPDEPFILHNVDVLSTLDLAAMIRAHSEQAALATLAVMQRNTSRYLLFNQQGQLCGRRTGADGPAELADSTEDPQALAFCGIHVLSPEIFAKLTEQGPFSIIDAYLRLAAAGESIAAFRADASRWRDLGRPEDVTLAAAEPVKDRQTRP